MSRLTLYRDDDPATITLDTDDAQAIATALAPIGVVFTRWALAKLPSDAEQEAILAAYRPTIDRLRAEKGYQAVDIVSLSPDHPDRKAMRGKFLSEHRHSEDEVRFFVAGTGMFYLHEAGHVHMLLCEAGDLISVPAGLRHWFDMGPEPSFAAIRLFTDPAGWIAQFTGDSIADRFPCYEPVCA